MKIIHTESSRGWGGQEIRILRESQLLINSGHSVTIICNSDSNFSLHRHLLAPDVPLVFSRIRRKTIFDLLDTRAKIYRIDFDIVICHSSTDHWIIALIRRFSKRKFPIVRVRHVSAPIKSNRATQWLYNRGCDAIITTSEEISKHIISSGLASEETVASIPTGIEPSLFGQHTKNSARKLLGLPDNIVLVGIVATLRSWKGHETLLRALALLPESIRLVIVGEGPQRGHLKDLALRLCINDRVMFMGHQNDVDRWYAAFDIYVHPSYANEGVPQSLLQAMATGLPIITCPVGGIPEAVSNYKLANLVPHSDPVRLADEVLRVTKTLNTLGARSEYRAAPFTEESMASDCSEIYKRIIHEHSNNSHEKSSASPDGRF